jgi:hypothetical protein
MSDETTQTDPQGSDTTVTEAPAEATAPSKSKKGSTVSVTTTSTSTSDVPAESWCPQCGAVNPSLATFGSRAFHDECVGQLLAGSIRAVELRPVEATSI